LKGHLDLIYDLQAHILKSTLFRDFIKQIDQSTDFQNLYTLDMIHDLQWVPAPQRKPVVAQRMGEGDADGRDVAALLSCSEDFTARAWQVSVDTQDKMTGTQVSCALHP
jgi:hypothetical protein